MQALLILFSSVQLEDMNGAVTLAVRGVGFEEITKSSAELRLDETWSNRLCSKLRLKTD